MPDIDNTVRRIPRFFSLLVASLCLFPVGVLEGDDGERKLAISTVIRDLSRRDFNSADFPTGVRVHLYDEILDAGTTVAPARQMTKEAEVLECRTRCLLFFVDKNPLAHFAHATEIMLWEIDQEGSEVDERLGLIEAEWWPVIWRAGELDMRGKPVFNTVASRATTTEQRTLGITLGLKEKPGAIIYEVPSVRVVMDPAQFGVLEPAEENAEEAYLIGGAMASACSTWAVIVNGDKDKGDTFDEDTDGIYAVLRGHGVPEDHIYYLSPHHGDPPCHRPDCTEGLAGPPCVVPSASDYLQSTAFDHLERIFTDFLPQQMGDSIEGENACDHFLFFSSSHGCIDELKHVADKCYGRWLPVGILKGWLDEIPCKKITVILEACYSGSFLDHVKCSPSAFPDQQRQVFTSTYRNESGEYEGDSYGDVDWEGDPNPGDVGSETVWGFIEAYGTGSADGILGGEPDKGISFSEATQYAIENDISATDENMPGVFPEPEAGVAPERWCYAESGEPDIKTDRFEVQPVAQSLINSGERNTVLVAEAQTFTDSTLVVTIRNDGDATLAGGTLKLFASIQPRLQSQYEVAQPAGLTFTLTDSLQWPTEFVQIGNTHLLTGFESGAHQEFQMDWQAAPFIFRFAPFLFQFAEVKLLATVDSPQDPVLLGEMPLSSLFKADNNAGDVKVEAIVE